MRGEHDLSSLPVLRPAFEQATAHSNVVVDLSDCAFIDSTVIALLFRAAKVVQVRGEQLALVIPPEQRQVARVAAMTGLSDFFAVHSSRETALAGLRHASGSS
jgi:anti-anti-sigma factor